MLGAASRSTRFAMTWTAALADVVQQTVEGTEKQVDGQTKRFKKNGRLGMYPAHMQIYRVKGRAP